MGILDFLRKGWNAAPTEPTPPDAPIVSPPKSLPPTRNKWGIHSTPIVSSKPKAASTVPTGSGTMDHPRNPSLTVGGMTQTSSKLAGTPSLKSQGFATLEDRQAAAIARMEALMANQNQEIVIPSCDKCQQGVVLLGGTAFNTTEKATSQAGRVMYCSCPGGKLAKGDLHKYKDN